MIIDIKSELGQRIRKSVKAKLAELCTYADEELPDYIMVMLANRKTDKQMSDDLALFLGDNTTEFVTWLKSLLVKLSSAGDGTEKAVAASTTMMSTSRKPPIVAKVAPRGRSSSKENGQPAGKKQAPKATVAPMRRDERKITEKSSSPEVERSHNGRSRSRRSRSRSGQRPHQRDGSPLAVDKEMEKADRKARRLKKSLGAAEKQQRRLAKQQPAPTSRSRSRSPQSAGPDRHVEQQQLSRRGATTRNRSSPTPSADRPIKSSVGAVISRDYTEEDYKPVGAVASKITVSSRRFNVITDMRATRKLLQQAVAEATGPAAPVPRKTETKKNALLKDLRDTILQKKRLREHIEKEKSVVEEDIHQLRRMLDRSSNDEDDDQQIGRVIHQTSSPTAHKDDGVEETSTAIYQTITRALHEVEPESSKAGAASQPKFFVTLEGVSAPQSKTPTASTPDQKASTAAGPLQLDVAASVADSSPATTTTADQTTNTSGNSISATSPTMPSAAATKSKERCRFWPNCRNQQCNFYHPSAPCKMFPRCAYGDMCLYIHPNCRFDASCKKPRCPFAHPSKAPTGSAVQPQIVVGGGAGGGGGGHDLGQVPCKFGNLCKNAHCQFQHPKPCRFGAGCLMRHTCPFSHPTTSGKNSSAVASKDSKFKWVAKTRPASQQVPTA